MKVIIPLAGKGTRLRPHTHVTPKPMLRVAGKPVMDYILEDLQSLGGVDEVVYITGHLKEKIEEYVHAEYPGFTAHFVEQEVQDGTAGAVRLARPYVDEDVLIIFVDTLFDADLSLVKRLPEDLAGVIWAKEVEDYQRFGVIVTDSDGNMKRIVEKPRDPISKLANIGLYYIRDYKLLFDGIDDACGGPRGAGREYYLTDAFQYMIDHGAKIRVEPVEGWYDAGQVDTILETNRHLLENGGRALNPQGGTNVRVHKPVRVAEGVHLENVEIGPNVTIETGCTLRNTKVSDSIIGANTTIEDTTLQRSIVGDQVRIRAFSGEANVGDHSELVGGS